MKLNEDGQTLPLIAFIAVGTCSLIALLGWITGHLNDRSQAQTAADAAALAGVLSGRADAIEVASKNGGVIVAYEELSGDVMVNVRVGKQEAQARATISQ